MYKCPHSGRTEFYETEDEWFDKFIWHLKNCTCPIMKLFHFKMIDQDDHIRAYWEMEGKLIVSWDLEFGMLLEYPKSLLDILEIRYPYSPSRVR